MRHSLLRSALFLFITCLSFNLFSQRVFRFSGVVRDAVGKPLPFASVSIDQARYGTLTNAQGVFSIALPDGKHEAVISYIGYKRMIDNINLQAPVSREYTLQEEELVLEEVFITSDGKDPAYAIIRQAIENKPINENPFERFSYQVYTKTVFKFQEDYDLDSLMRLGKLFGGSDEDMPDTSSRASDILFLSETISEVFLQQPNQAKEIIKSSRISGNSEQFSILGGLVNRYDPYQNRFSMNDNDRGIVSPIADQAMLYYEYKLLGSKIEKGKKTYKIRVRPRRKFDPVFSGLVYIADSSYAMAGLELESTKENQLEFLDTLSIRQTYDLVQGHWLPVQTRMGFSLKFNILGFKLPLEGFLQSLLDTYNPQFAPEKKFFDREIIAVTDSALKRGAEYWESIRPVPLSESEFKDYSFKDSVEQVRRSPEYLDSLTRVNRKIKLSEILLTGKTFENYRKKTTLSLESLLQTFAFNPMEGFLVAPAIAYKWEQKDKSTFGVDGRLRYGFADEKLSWQIGANYNTTGKYPTSIRLSGGYYPREFSDFPQIGVGLNTLYALYSKQSYLRLYRRSFVKAELEKKIANGLDLSITASHERRSTMTNHSDYSFFKNNANEYVTNPGIFPHNATVLRVDLSFQPFNRYISAPTGNIDLGSKWPRLGIAFEQAFSGSEVSSEYQRIQARLQYDLSVGLWGNATIQASAGYFFNSTTTFLPDYFHFLGNETLIRNNSVNTFQLQAFYRFANTQPYVQAHMEHSFDGFVLNKIPFVRRLALSEYLGLHVLKQEGRDTYMEMSVGIEKRLFKIIPIRVDFAWRLLGTFSGDRHRVLVGAGF